MSRPSAGRWVACRVLESLETQGGFANELFQALWQKTSERLAEELHPSERALAREIVYGVSRWRSRLDWAIQQVSHRSLEALDARLRAILRMGAYQILELERVPDWAAVSQSVEMAKRMGRFWASGFVNAVLRRLVSRKDELAQPVFSDPMDELSIGQSHPRWLVERWLERFGRERTEAILKANNERAAVTLRVNSQKADLQEVVAALETEGFETSLSPFVPGMVRLKTYPKEVTTTEVFLSGACIVQDEASALVGYMVAPKPGQVVVDACAAPGGKATHLAELASDEATVLALDRNEARTRRLLDHCCRMGLGSIAVLVADSLMPPLRRPVSSVLLDAPCSGLGALRRHPEGKWLKGPEIIRQHSGLQEELLGALAPLVAEGGILVYSVCTFEPEETTEIIERWLERNRTWTVEDPAALIPEPSRRWVTGRGELLILPEPGGPDGFYAVRLRRAG